MAQTRNTEVMAPARFVVARGHRHNDEPRDYLRSFQVVGRDGLAHLAFGSRDVARVFDSLGEAEDIVRRLRRRTTIAAYDYLVEEVSESIGA